MNLKVIPIKTCTLIFYASCTISVALAEEPEKQATEDAGSTAPIDLQYFSVFDNYLPFDEYPDIGWKEANDRVGEIGGWRAYAKIVQEEARRKAEEMEQKEQNNGGAKQ